MHFQLDWQRSGPLDEHLRHLRVLPVEPSPKGGGGKECVPPVGADLRKGDYAYPIPTPRSIRRYTRQDLWRKAINRGESVVELGEARIRIVVSRRSARYFI